MIVTLDGRRLPGEFTNEPTLRAILDRVRAEHLERRLVVEVALNGAPLVEQELSDRLDRPANHGDQIDLGSDDPQTLAKSALSVIAEQLALAADAHVNTAEMLQSGRTSEAVSQFGEILNIWHNCRTTIVECARLTGEEWSDRVFAGRTLGAHLSELTAGLREIRDAFEARDYVLLGDLLRYEMPTVCTSWADIFRQLADDPSIAVTPGR